ncbi:hypothetical protein RB195_011728 [Necator americanus]|uniref:Uncharacterized protein n=1 Tax=Necator americanus TaxID=51031 RepID=A0ABR1D4M5_NECAM
MKHGAVTYAAMLETARWVKWLNRGGTIANCSEEQGSHLDSNYAPPRRLRRCTVLRVLLTPLPYYSRVKTTWTTTVVAVHLRTRSKRHGGGSSWDQVGPSETTAMDGASKDRYATVPYVRIRMRRLLLVSTSHKHGYKLGLFLCSNFLILRIHSLFRGKAHPTPKLETPSVSSRRPIRDWSLKRSALARRRLEERGVAVFKHRRRTYLTCFGAVHVKVVACFTGFNVLVGVCCALFYCVITSQEQRRPNLKLWLIPLAPVVICLLFLFVGIIQRKPKLLYPFIVLQIFSGFGTAVSMAMIIISVPCNTKHILRLIVDVNLEEAEYKRSAMTIFSVLSLTLFVQIWYLRTVCNCFRYFTDLQKFEERTANV